MAMTIGAAGQTIEAAGDVEVGKTVAENAASMTMDYGSADLGTLKMVLADGMFYLNFGKMTGRQVRQGGPQGQEQSADPAIRQLLDQMDPSKAFKQYHAALKSFSKKGVPVEIDGVKAQPYRVVLDTSKMSVFDSLPASAAESIPRTLTYVMYVGPDNLLRRVSYAVAGSKSRVDYSKWGEPVHIKAPAAGDITDKDISELFGAAAHVGLIGHWPRNRTRSTLGAWISPASKNFASSSTATSALST